MKSCIWLTLVALLGMGSIGTDMLSEHPGKTLPQVGEVVPSAPGEGTVYAAGVVEGAQRAIDLQFELPGRIVEIPVQEGQTVRRGDICARLDDALWRHQLLQREAALDVAHAELDRLINGATPEARDVVKADASVAEVDVVQAKANWERAAKLYQQKAIAAQDHDRHKFAYEAAVARLKQARARVAEIEAAARPDEVRMAEAKVEMAAAAAIESQTQLDYTVLKAPIDGVILRIDMEPGELISAERPQPVVTMTSLSQVRVRAYVEELDALALHSGAEATVTVDGQPDVQYHGRVTWTAPVMGPKSQRHHQPGEKYDVEVREVLIVLDNADELVVGLPVNVFITKAASEAKTELTVTPATPASPNDPAL